MTKKCAFEKKNGERCGADAQTGTNVCVFHDPAKASESSQSQGSRSAKFCPVTLAAVALGWWSAATMAERIADQVDLLLAQRMVVFTESRPNETICMGFGGFEQLDFFSFHLSAILFAAAGGGTCSNSHSPRARRAQGLDVLAGTGKKREKDLADLRCCGEMKICRKAIAPVRSSDEENFRLHKFRATFATRCLWSGWISEQFQAG